LASNLCPRPRPLRDSIFLFPAVPFHERSYPIDFQVIPALDPSRGPGHFEAIDAPGVAEAEIEAVLGGGQMASAAGQVADEGASGDPGTDAGDERPTRTAADEVDRQDVPAATSVKVPSPLLR
jgi:hypothetical protein